MGTFYLAKRLQYSKRRAVSKEFFTSPEVYLGSVLLLHFSAMTSPLQFEHRKRQLVGRPMS
jgi:hypothetical protein